MNSSSTKPMERLLKKFYSHLNHACDGGTAHTFQTGEIPFTMNGNNLNDLTLHEKFWDLYGFKKCEIEFLLDKALGNNLSYSCIIKETMSWLKEENDEYFFNHNQSEGIFNTAYV